MRYSRLAPICAVILVVSAIAGGFGRKTTSSHAKSANHSVAEGAGGGGACSAPGSLSPVDQGAGLGAAGLSWRIAFNGYGGVARAGRAGTACVTLTPARAASPADTHAALVVSRRNWRDLEVEMRVRTNRQLRSPQPNPWEVGWILWHYTSNQNFYYVVLKPNGWELGKEDPAYPGNQRFLATGGHPVFPVGRWYTVTVEQRRDVITVTVGGHRLVNFSDTERPYLSGQVGLYTEDSSATFEPVAVHSL